LEEQSTMPKRARLLYALQSLDIQLARKARRYRAVEASLGESEAFRAAQATLEAAQEEHSRSRAILLDRELETQSVSDKLDADSQRLYSGQIRSPKELGDLQKETEYLKRRKASLEDQQLEAMMAMEEATTRLAIANEEYVVAEAAWKTENSELSQEYDTLKQELAQLSAQRKRVLEHITERDVSEYTALRRLRKGVAVVAVKEGVCQVCRVSIPGRDLERATETDELQHCFGCDRILYVPE
jgi:predicted  nucleic acid-binding Zn-ribbon protein